MICCSGECTHYLDDMICCSGECTQYLDIICCCGECTHHSDDMICCSGECTHTPTSANPWWSVDLGHQVYVTSVEILNRDVYGKVV